MTIKELQKEAYRIAFEKGWHERIVGIPERLALIHSEVSEALECYRDNQDEFWYNAESTPPGKPEGVLAELADVVIRCLDMAEAHRWDLDKAIREKMAFNEIREYRHGGKKI